MSIYFLEKGMIAEILFLYWDCI